MCKIHHLRCVSLSLANLNLGLAWTDTGFIYIRIWHVPLPSLYLDECQMLVNQALCNPAGGLIPARNSIYLSMQIRLYISTQNFIVTKHLQKNGKEMLGKL